MDTERGPFLSNPFVARAARWGLLAWSVIGVLILVGGFYRFVLYPIRIVFPPLLVALIVIYLLNPIITALHDRGLARIWGALATYVVFLSLVGLALAYAIPVFTHQAASFTSGVPTLLNRAERGFIDFSNRLGLHINSSDFLAAFDPKSGAASRFLGRITSFTSGVVHLAFVMVLGPLIAFYLLVDLPKIRRGADALVPASRRDEVRGLARRVGDTLGGFFRGQLIVAILVGLGSTLGFYIIGLPYFALLGGLTGLFALVPLIGTVIAAIPTLFVALTASGPTDGLLHITGGWRLALAGTIVLILVQQLDTRLLTPRLHGEESRLHPVTVLLSLLVGGTLLGLWGMLLAVPTVAALKVLLLHFWDTRSSWPPRPAPARPARTTPVAGAPRPPGGEQTELGREPEPGLAAAAEKAPNEAEALEGEGTAEGAEAQPVGRPRRD
jgi:predicted PurR-regulated permease PerM